MERGGEWGGVVPLPSRLEGLGEQRKLPQWGFGVFELEKNTSGGNKFVFVDICMPRNSMAYWQSHGPRPGTWCFRGRGSSAPTNPLLV